MTDVFNQYLALLQNHKSLPKVSESKSFIDVAGFPHYENVCSNILAFYLNAENEHGLGNLFFSSLMSLANSDESLPDKIQIERERYTDNGGRLDLVIETSNQLVGIENKIFHTLINDLEDYSSSLESWNKDSDLKIVKIVLSIKKENPNNGFICITYSQLWERVRERLGEYVTTASQKWLLYLLDFMNSIDNLSGEKMELTEDDKFFIDNAELVDSFIKAKNKFDAKLNDKVKKLSNIVEKHVKCQKQSIYAKSVLVHDFVFSEYEIAFDLKISIYGWDLILFARNKPSQDYLKQIMTAQQMKEQKSENINSRYILEKWDLNTDLSVVATNLEKHIELFIEAEETLAKELLD